MSRKVLAVSLAVLALGAVAYHMTASQVYLLGTTGHKSVHLFFILSLVLLSSLQKGEEPEQGKQKGRKPRLVLPSWLQKVRDPWLVLLLYVVGLTAVGYIFLNRAELELRYGFPQPLDIVMAIFLAVVVLEATRRGMELAIPLIAVFFIFYALFGEYLPPVIRAYKVDLGILAHQIALDGILGSLLTISADYVFLFIVFGGVLEAAGIGRLFKEIRALVGSKLKSGPAMISIVGELIIGGPLQSPSASVGISGPFTIPMMKKAGYTSEQAGAIEAAGGAGAQISPPVMGSAIYIMNGITGISVATLTLAGIIPTFLYFISVGTYAHLQALRMGVKPLVGEKVNWKEMALESRLFVVPVTLIMVLLIKGFTPTYAIFWTIIVTILMALVRPKTMPSWREWVDGFTKGAIMGAKVGISLAALGIVVKVLTMTGLAIRLPGIVETLSGGNFVIALSLVALVTLILGCGVPTPAAYILVAITAAPVLIRLFGVTPLQAHYFVFYYAVMAMLTPPVGPAAFVASAIAKTTYMKVAVEQVKPAIVGFIMPLAFIFTPVVLLKPQNLALEIPMVLLLCISTLFFQASFVGYFFGPTRRWERVLYGIFACGILAGFIAQSMIVAIVGTFLGIVLALYQRHRTNSLSVPESSLPPPQKR